MKAKKPTAARKPAVQAKKKASPRKPRTPASAPAKKKRAVRKKVSVRKTRKPANVIKKVKSPIRAKVKRAPRTAATKAKASLKPAPRTVAKAKPTARRVLKLSAPRARRRRRIVKLPAFLRRPLRKVVRNAASTPATVAMEAETTAPADPIAPPAAPRTKGTARKAAGGRAAKAVRDEQPLTDPVIRSLKKSTLLTELQKPPSTAAALEIETIPDLPAESAKPRRPRRPRSRPDDETDSPGSHTSPRDLGGYKLPAILFEGDHPEPSAIQPVAGQPAAMSMSAASQQQPPSAHPATLPEAYGTQRVTVTVRDPHWLCVQWDLTREQLRHYNAQSVHRHLVLRVHENKLQAEAAGEIHVHPESRHWFVHVPQPAATHVVELGYYRRSNGWVSVGVSDPATTPAAGSPIAEVRFATVPHNLPLPGLTKTTQPTAGKFAPQLEASPTLRALDHPPKTAAPDGFTPSLMMPEQERALLEIIHRKQPPLGTADSAGVGELLQGGLPENISSSAAATGAGISSLSSPHGGPAPASRDFWFNVNAELVIYGATERDAAVSIGGRRVALRGDGSFCCRFALPDGQYELPATAVSPDETEARHADLKFTRATTLIGEVGQHPQDQALKTPGA